MATESDDLASKLENYVLQLRQVEAALTVDPTHVELLKIKADLNELIEITKKLITANISEEAPLTKKAKLSSECAVTSRRFDTMAGFAGSSNSSHHLNSDFADKIVSKIKTLNDDRYREFLFKAFDESRPPEILKAVIKRFSNRGKKSIKRQCGGRGKEEDESDTDEPKKINGLVDSPSTGRESSRTALKAPLIYRGDLIPPNDGLLFMTVKKIRLKPNIYRGHSIVAAVVCVVNSQKNLVFWSLINWSNDEICETFPAETGITSESLKIGLPIDQVATLLKQAIKGNILVGYNIQDDLRSLDIVHDRNEDIADYFQDDDGSFSILDLECLLEKPKRGAEIIGNKVICETRNIYALHTWMKGKQDEFPVFSNSPMVKIVQAMRKQNAVSRQNVDVSSNPSPEDEKATEICHSVIESCTEEIKPELLKLKIVLQPDEIMHCAMLQYWRKVIAEMRRPETLDRILPLSTMGKLSTLRNITEDDVKKIMQDDKCLNPYNNDQFKIIVNILNEGTETFKKMVTSVCNRCAGRGHIAKICTRLKNKKAVDEYYKKYHPEMVAQQQDRRKRNLKRNRKLRGEVGDYDEAESQEDNA